ncbi:FecR family protein [Gayadomonas joobiniege]|uniref:FecR family protein n=1 Tax=Gayadomonas joobiniege TaxID=1234606 RepID=UPI000364A2FF|nr:FecR family protein [Gayadomonas joobiniege]
MQTKKISAHAHFFTLVSLLFVWPVCADQPAGKTIIAKGQVEATASAESRTLTRRDPVYKVDTVTTGNNSSAQFKMVDGGLLAVKANTQLEISSYQYDPETGKGSAIMKLITGGVRSISGHLKSHDGSYQMNTPVGSIGIRGTHFEIEIIDGELFIAVWDGAIDLLVTGSDQEKVSLGLGEDFSYAQVSETGEVTELLNPPANFSPNAEQPVSQNDTDASNSNKNQQSEQKANNTETAQMVPEMLDPNKTGQQASADVLSLEILPELASEQTNEQASKVDLENDAQNPSPIIDRVGQAQFDLSDHSFASNLGAVTDAQMGIQVNFDKQTIEDGFLSFNDEKGEWYARFNGAIRQAELELGVNFAAHGDNLAEGEIEAQFIDKDSIGGAIKLQEVENSQVQAGGQFTLDEAGRNED